MAESSTVFEKYLHETDRWTITMTISSATYSYTYITCPYCEYEYIHPFSLHVPPHCTRIFDELNSEIPTDNEENRGIVHGVDEHGMRFYAVLSDPSGHHTRIGHRNGDDGLCYCPYCGLGSSGDLCFLYNANSIASASI